MTIMLTRWRCEQGHAALGVPWDAASTEQATALAAVTILMASSGLGDQCGICGGALTPESQPTTFDTFDEALTTLIDLATAQLRTLVDLAAVERAARRYRESATGRIS
jgi:hypothetical protein